MNTMMSVFTKRRLYTIRHYALMRTKTYYFVNVFDRDEWLLFSQKDSVVLLNILSEIVFLNTSLKTIINVLPKYSNLGIPKDL